MANKLQAKKEPNALAQSVDGKMVGSESSFLLLMTNPKVM